MENKKNNLLIIIVAVIVLALIILVVLKNANNKMSSTKSRTLSQTESELNRAVTLDTTTAITADLNNINVEDTTDKDLDGVDQELQKL